MDLHEEFSEVLRDRSIKSEQREFLSQLPGMDKVELEQMCESLYGLYQQAIAQYEQAIKDFKQSIEELETLKQSKPSVPQLRFRAVLPGIQFLPSELAVLERSAMFRSIKGRDISIARLEGEFGQDVFPIVIGLIGICAIELAGNCVRVSASVSFELEEALSSRVQIIELDQEARS